jgi:Ca2+-binding RTX toxin-like protein
VVGVSGNSSITGGSGTATGAGGLGVNSYIIGAAGDTVTGGTGTISVNGSSGSETISGGVGAMTVQGGSLDSITGSLGKLQAFLNASGATGSAESINLTAGHGAASLRDVASNISVVGGTTTFGAANGNISVTGFATATDSIQSLTSVNASNQFIGSSSTSNGSTTLTFVDGSTMTLAGVTSVGSIKLTQ